MHKSFIVGNGLIARSMKGAVFNLPTIVIASGVSNSSESSVKAFNREYEFVSRLLESYNEFRAVYFSSTLVSIPEILTPYAKHKRRMETLVISRCKENIIFRLPQIVGPATSPTLVATFYSRLRLGQTINLQTRATRRLLWHMDLARLVTLILTKKPASGPITVAPKHSVSPFDIASFMASRCNIKSPSFTYSDIGYLDNNGSSSIEPFLDKSDPILSKSYWQDTLVHYINMMETAVNAPNLKLRDPHS